MKRLCVAIVAAFMAASGSADADSGVIKMPMSEKYSLVEYSFIPYGSIMIATTLYNVEGKTLVCGFWTINKRLQSYVRRSRTHQRARQNTYLDVAGHRVMDGLHFIREVPLDDFQIGTEARCKYSKVPWQKGFSGDAIKMDTKMPRHKG